MAPSERRAKELAELEPPRSIERLLKFLEDYNRELQSPAMALGSIGLGALSFTNNLITRSTPGASGMADILARYSITVGEVQEFVRWLTLWNDKRTEIETIRVAPETVFVTQVIQGSTEMRVVEYSASPTVMASSATVVTSQIAAPKQEVARPAAAPSRTQDQAPAETETPRRRVTQTTEGEPELGARTRSSTQAVTDVAPAKPSSPDTISRAWKDGRNPTPDERFSRALAVANRDIWTANLGLVSGVGGHITGQAEAMRTMGLTGISNPGLLVSQAAPSTEFVTMSRVMGTTRGRLSYPEPDVEVTSQPVGRRWRSDTPVPGETRVPTISATQPGNVGAVQVSPNITPIGPVSSPAGVRFAGTSTSAIAQVANAGIVPGSVPSVGNSTSSYSQSGTSPQTSPPLSTDGPRGFLAQDVLQRLVSQTFASAPSTWLAGTAAAFLSTKVISDVLGGLFNRGGEKGAPPKDLFREADKGKAEEAWGENAGAVQGSGLGLPTFGTRGLATPESSMPVRTAGYLASSKDLLGLGAPLLFPPSEGSPNPRETMPSVHPLMGQITLVAPPMLVASEGAERSGAAASIDWQTLASGMTEIDETSLAMLKQALPPGYQAIYPALPMGSGGPSAVNLRLAPSLLKNLLGQSYGAAAQGLANKASSMAGSVGPIGGGAKPLDAKLVPTKRPMGNAPSLMGDNPAGNAKGALAVAGEGQARRSGALDFLGMPIRLAPSLGGRAELADEVALRSGSAVSPSGTPIRPHAFAPLRERLFPSFQSVNAEPDRTAWQRAAPSFGMRDDSPMSVLSPDSRIAARTPSSPRFQVEGGSPVNPFRSALGGISSPMPIGSVSIGQHGQRTNHAADAPSMPIGSVSIGQRGPRFSRGDAPSMPIGSVSIGQGVPRAAGDPNAPAMPIGSVSLSRMSPSAPIGATANSRFGLSQSSAPASANADQPSESSSIGQGSFAFPGSPIASSGDSLAEAAPRPTYRRSPMTAGLTHLSPAAPAPELAPISAPLFSKIAPSAPSGMPRVPSTPNLARIAPMDRPQPNMIFHAAPAMPASKPSGSIQFSKGQSAVASSAPGGTTAANPSHSTKAHGDDKGQRSSDVNLLAGEVWAILKRRLSSEMDRRGRW